MTEYKIECRGDQRDTLEAFNDGDDIAFYSRHDGPLAVSVYVSPADARTFARGILALADEVDGGVPTAVKVGDRVRILEDHANGATVKRGDVLTVLGVKKSGVETEGLGYDGRWYIDHDKVELVDDPTDTRPKVGDTVRILLPEGCFDPEHVGSVGLLTEIDDTDCKYRVRLDDREIVWAYEVEPAMPAVPSTASAPSRAALLDQARDLLGGSGAYTAHDLITLADYLAG